MKLERRVLRSSVLAMSLTWITPGCDERDLDVLDSLNRAPSANSFAITPDSINVDGITPIGGTYQITLKSRVRATTSDGIGNSISVESSVHRLDGTGIISTAMLHDDGLSPDSVAGDGTFSGELSFSISRTQTGRYLVSAVARDRNGATSNELLRRLILTRRNSPPQVSDLIAPSTVQRPGSGNVLFSMSIAASDSDGLADVRETYFRNLDSPSQAKIFLFDDGGANGSFSGDLLAGDGRFSVVVLLPDTVSPRTFRFLFQAADSFGDTSASPLHLLTVQ
jgi:hypothetical protein